MKWLLLIGIAFFLLSTRRYLVGDLVRTVKKLPDDFKDGKKRVDDPASAAKDVGPDATTKKDPSDERP